MMENAKRYHPYTMIFDFLGLIKGLFFAVLYLFVIQYNSESTFVLYGRYAFYAIVVIGMVYILLKWCFYKYYLDDTAFHIFSGIFVKKSQTIPFTKVQNVKRHTSIIHRFLRVTSIHFETGLSGEEARVAFGVVTKDTADRLEKQVGKNNDQEKSLDYSVDMKLEQKLEETFAPKENRRIHFTPTRKDTWKASFTSFSFLIIVPIIGTIYTNVKDVFGIGEHTEGFISTILNTWWSTFIVVLLLIVLSISLGIVYTFLKYGKYEIASDINKIYITKGLLEETTFSITKDRVQAIEINQPILKRMLGLAEVKLTCSGSFSLDSKESETNSLYPFLPIEQAYSILSDLLPEYEITESMEKLPKKSLVVRLCKPYWFWIIATGAFFYFQPPIFSMEISWWLFSIILLLFIVSLRVLDFINTRFVLNENMIQCKSGSFSTSLYISKREKIIEVSLSRSLLQRKVGLATIGTMNRATPVQFNGVNDIPMELAGDFLNWYVDRRKEVEIDADSIYFEKEERKIKN
ncbi:PH domain-containing protein [Evansella sp. AB-rgal1]|uniref:PH domain-containing protein n=1 Tax=Evansella sp. AB-rgal1 TaxID=3242696 RepID=UPI00359D4B45